MSVPAVAASNTKEAGVLGLTTELDERAVRGVALTLGGTAETDSAEAVDGV